MDEEKLKKLQAKLLYYKESGQHYKAFNLNAKITKAIAKNKYNETIGKKPSKFKSIIKKSVEAVKEVANDVIDGAPSVIEKAKVLVDKGATKVEDKIREIKLNKEKVNDPPVEPAVENPVEPPVETPVKEISQKRVVTGGIGQAYDDEGGVGNIRVNGKVINKGDEGYEAAKKELLAFNKNQKLREIKLKKLAEKNK